VIGSAGNPNTYHVVYSNNPNGTGTGTTPDDKNIVFTYKTIFNKVKEDGTTALTGADFKLEKKVKGAWVDVTKLHTGEGAINPTKTGDDKGSTFTFSGLDDGVYKLTETKTPKGYNSIDPIEFTISATHVIESDDPKLTALTGTVGAEFTLKPSITDGSLTGNVVNKEGSTLPSTGGIGTTIFYVLGGLLVIGSGIILVARRKASE
jgi:LPXTG-motif cell wall-anchored protein